MFDLEKMRDMAVAKTFSSGEVIIEEGATLPYSMYIILKGKVGIYKEYRSPLAALLNTLGAGDFFGETSLLLLQPRTATCVAMEANTTVFEVSQMNVYELIEKHPEILFTISKALCERVSELDNKLAMRLRRFSK